jgi:hypothetical protein
MTKTFRFLLVLIGILLFAVGLLLGQQIQRSKFDKYLRPRVVTPMEIGVLRANIEAISGRMEFGVPTIYYDPSCACFTASAVITSDLMKKPLNEVRGTLLILAIKARNAAEHEFPELSPLNISDIGAGPDRDFKMTFWELNLDHSRANGTVAEYVDGKIVFK